MKALILAAGKGSRLKPVTNSIAKHLIPLANKPLIFYILEQIKEACIEDVGIVISLDTGTEIKTVVGDGTHWGIRISYIIQDKPLGIAHAVKTGRDFLADSPFLLFLGDNLMKDGVKGMVTEFNSCSVDALIALKQVDDPRAFGVAEVDGSNKLIRVVEKPQEPRSNLAIVGAYIFRPVIHDIIDQLKPSQRGEYEITDAIQKLLESRKSVNSYVLQNWWLDTGKKEDLLTANKILLDENLKLGIGGDVDKTSLTKGVVEIGAGSVVKNSLIMGPVSIAEDCRIVESYIGPYASLGKGVVVENSAIKQSIIFDFVHIKHVARLTDSVVGRNAFISEGENGCTGTRVFIGDNARIEL
jgi:glucose-1-phosphate thymidylyltransferase